MALGEAEVTLFAGLADEALDVFEPPGSGPDRLGAGGVDDGGGVLFHKVAKPQDGSHRLGAARVEGGLRPCPAVFAQHGGAVHRITAGGADRGAEARRAKDAAELARLDAGVELDLLHSGIEEPHAAAVPTHPNLVADVFGRRFVIGFLHLHKTVPVYAAPGFLVAREEGVGQRLESYIPAFNFIVRPQQQYTAADVSGFLLRVARDVCRPERFVLEGGNWQANRTLAALRALGVQLTSVKGRPNQKLVENFFNRLWTRLSLELPYSQVGRYRDDDKLGQELYCKCQAGRCDPRKNPPSTPPP